MPEAGVLGLKKFDYISQVIEEYYSKKSVVTRIKQRSTDLRKIVSNAIERTAKKYDLQIAQLKDTEKRDKFKVYGELITAFGYGVLPGAKELVCENYYTGKEVTIPLDPDISVMDNGKKYFEKYNKQILDNEGYETTDIFKVDSKLDDEFWEKYFIEYSINVDVRKFASEVIKKLKNDGNEIYIITARGSFLSHSANVMFFEENKNIVLEWLRKNEIEYDKIIFSPEDKLNICLENNINIMIEDKPANINKISTKIPVICFHAGYNKSCNGNNIIRCHSWYDIYSKIKEM